MSKKATYKIYKDPHVQNLQELLLQVQLLMIYNIQK